MAYTLNGDATVQKPRKLSISMGENTAYTLYGTETEARDAR